MLPWTRPRFQHVDPWEHLNYFWIIVNERRMQEWDIIWEYRNSRCLSSLDILPSSYHGGWDSCRGLNHLRSRQKGLWSVTPGLCANTTEPEFLDLLFSILQVLQSLRGEWWADAVFDLSSSLTTTSHWPGSYVSDKWLKGSSWVLHTVEGEGTEQPSQSSIFLTSALLQSLLTQREGLLHSFHAWNLFT